MADNEQQDDYLSNMLNALNEKEQESQSYNDPETIARQAKEKLDAAVSYTHLTLPTNSRV